MHGFPSEGARPSVRDALLCHGCGLHKYYFLTFVLCAQENTTPLTFQNPVLAVCPL